MSNYTHGTLPLKKPKHVASNKKVLIYKFSFGEESKSIRFFSESGKQIDENTRLYDCLLLKFQQKLQK